MTTFGNLLADEAVPAEYRQRLSSYRPSVSSFIVWLGLDTSCAARSTGTSTHVVTGAGPEVEYQAAWTATTNASDSA